MDRQAPAAPVEPWQYQAAMRALLQVGWARLSAQERDAINRWEGR